MSLPPQRKPIDLDKFTMAYISNLNAQIANDAKVYNAVMANITGQAPPSQPADTRPIEEKLLDVERLKLDLRTQLKTLTDATNIQRIMSDLEQPSEIYRLQMAVQSFPSLYSLLKPNYAVGVPAIIFIDALDRLIQQQDQTRGVNIGLQESTGQDILLGIQELKNFATGKDYDDLLSLLDESEADSELIDSVQRLQYSMLTRENLMKLEEEQNATGEPLMQGVSSVLEQLPTRQRLKEMMNRLVGEEEDRDPILNELKGDIPDEIVLQNLEDLKSLASEPQRPALSRQSTEMSGMTEELPYRQYQQPFNPNYQQPSPNTYTGGFSQSAPAQETQETQELFPMGGNGIKRRMRGRGLVSTHSATTSREKKQKIRLKLEGVIEKPKPYYPFGRYALNRNKLEQGILMIRSQSGAVVPKLPTQKVSKKICDILKVILSNSVPSYEAINDLEDTDKDLLHKILKEAHIHHISTPSPNISKQEEDLRRFIILKGQMMAGQNSPIAIKELKRLIIKMMSQDILPKREAHQALLELAHLETI
jgi:hypothetical protein